MGIPEKAWKEAESLLTNKPLQSLGRRALEQLDFIGGIVGGERPSGYSRSPVLWNRLFQLLGLRGFFAALDLPQTTPFSGFAEAFLGIPGCVDLTVTSPYKATAYQCLPSLSMEITAAERVDHIGCLNHIMASPATGRITADITDGQGMVRAVKKRKPLRGADVLLAGAGGAATAIGYEIVQEGANLIIANIVEEDGRNLAKRLSAFAAAPQTVTACSWEDIQAAASNCSVIISAITSSTPLDSTGVEKLDQDCLLADTRYGDRAEFVRAASEAGRQCVDGRQMLVGQFVAAAEVVGINLGVAPAPLSAALGDVERWFLGL